MELPEEISCKLKDIPEQREVVGPLVKYLIDIGWSQEQIIFGRSEWMVPKNPSELTKREKGRSYKGFPVDVAVFDSPKNIADPRNLMFILK